MRRGIPGGGSVDDPPPMSVADRTLDVLDAFCGARSLLGVSDVAHLARLPKSTAHRILSIMERRGFLTREDKRYRLAEHVFELGNRALRLRNLRERTVPHMADLYRATLETVHLAVLSGRDVVYIEKIHGSNVALRATAVGARAPAHCTALGKALLSEARPETLAHLFEMPLRRFTERTISTVNALEADLDRARTDGVAVEYEECHRGLACVAAPILNPATGVPLAAISISVPSDRFNARRLARLLQTTTAAI